MSSAARGGRRRALFIQFANPAAYPPVEHSTRILADAGWEIVVLGTPHVGSESFSLPHHPGIRVEMLPLVAPGWRQKVHFARYGASALAWTARFRPSLIYVSDPFVAPVGVALRAVPNAQLVYHEHDSPPPGWEEASASLKAVAKARRFLGRVADLCILPNEARARRFRDESGRKGPVWTVWNCPELGDVGRPRDAGRAGRLALIYQGSIVPDRLPLALVEGVARAGPGVELWIVGYETIGGLGHVRRIRSRAAELGISERVHVKGPLQRRALLQLVGQADVGWGVMPDVSDDFNLLHMVGASNKSFEYLARGVPPIVSNSPEWVETFVDPGYGVACDPRDVEQIASTLVDLRDDPGRVRAMGEGGRRRILEDWNYEHQFEHVRLFAEEAAGG